MRLARLASVALCLGLLVGGQAQGSQAQIVTRPNAVYLSVERNANRRTGPGEWRYRRCRFQWRDGRRNWSATEVELTIRCAASHWSVDVSTALRIASCESGLYQFSDNPYSSASGVYQMLASTWASWRSSITRTWGSWWRLSTSVWNARANVVTAIVHAHLYGWSAWVCQ